MSIKDIIYVKLVVKTWGIERKNNKEVKKLWRNTT